ncbi:MAG TPA: hypothetical protein VKC53_01355 [Patescibacteria group bacterium]|nr:hypothetical protein [Patescibacteria group bacterium]
MKKILIFIYILFSLTLLFYVALPDFDFPKPVPGSLESKEPADTESPLRRAYFTDATRSEVLNWYEEQFKHSSFHNLPLPTYLLNYPPEDSGSIIRDQTRSTFLQEIVHPMRETVFINGYEPSETDYKDRIVIEGTHFRQKIIIKFVPSSLVVRFLITLFTLASIPIIYLAFVPEVNFLKNIIKKGKTI